MKTQWMARIIGAAWAAIGLIAFCPSQALAQDPDEPLPQEPAAVSPAGEKPWYDSIKMEALADGYAQVNYALPKPQADSNRFRGFDPHNGFALSWFGLDLSHDSGPVGGTVSLRFGPSARIFAGPDSASGLENVRQAFGTYRPSSKLTLDFGKFDAICGAEVADSHRNFNYTRGLLYWLGQPLFHTGLRATYQVSEALSLRLMAVNGWNRSVDNNIGKTFGGQVSLVPSSKVSVIGTYIGGPEQDDSVHCDAGFGYNAITHSCEAHADALGGDFRNGSANKRWRHFVDLVLTVNPSDSVSLVANGDWVTEKILDASGQEKTIAWMGAMVAGRYAFSDVYAVALRGEWYRDKDGFTTGVVDAQGNAADVTLESGTLTLEAKPSPNLILRLENRVDVADTPVFRHGVEGGADKTQVTSLLGVVFTTGNTWK